MKSFRQKDGSDEPPAEGGRRNAERDFHGQRRSNDTHASTTDSEVRVYRKGKGKEAKLCFMGHALMENRHGLVVYACLTLADGHAERIAALHDRAARRSTACGLVVFYRLAGGVINYRGSRRSSRKFSLS